MNEIESPLLFGSGNLLMKNHGWNGQTVTSAQNGLTPIFIEKYGLAQCESDG